MIAETRLARATDAETIACIYNQGIEDRGATFETRHRTAGDIESKLAHADTFPIIVAVEDGEVVGWAGLSAYRSRPCYDGIAEFSIYLDRAARGRGLGRQLLSALVDAARERGFWKLLSRIFPANMASRALCRSCGFREVGIYEKHSCLDGEWLDVVIVERLIPENLRQPASSDARPSSGNA